MVRKLVRDSVVVTESDVSEVLCEPGSQAMSCFSNVQGRAERTKDVIDDVDRSTSERVCDMKGIVIGC